MVPGDGEDLPLVAHDEADEEAIDEGDGLRRGHGAVIQVTGDDDNVDVLAVGDVGDLVQDGRLVLKERDIAEGAPDMQVARMENAHKWMVLSRVRAGHQVPDNNS